VKKIKIAELVLLALSALVALAKSVVKFIDGLGKIRDKPATNTT